MAELDGLVGLTEVKREVRLTTDLTRVEQIRRQRGLPVLEHSRHVVFTGNPGTGKTTVARLLAQIYRTLGVVTKGHLVETDRSQLVAGYVGQTAIQVRKAFDEADEGVLLIDEAYALVRGGGERLRQGGDRHDREARGGPPRFRDRDRCGLPRGDGPRSSMPTRVCDLASRRRSTFPTTRPTNSSRSSNRSAAARSTRASQLHATRCVCGWMLSRAYEGSATDASPATCSRPSWRGSPVGSSMSTPRPTSSSARSCPPMSRMSASNERFVALVAAVVMVCVAVVIRSNIDDNGSGTASPSGPVTIACVTELADQCNGLKNVTVRVEDAVDHGEGHRCRHGAHRRLGDVSTRGRRSRISLAQRDATGDSARIASSQFVIAIGAGTRGRLRADVRRHGHLEVPGRRHRQAVDGCRREAGVEHREGRHSTPRVGPWAAHLGKCGRRLLRPDRLRDQ